MHIYNYISFTDPDTYLYWLPLLDLFENKYCPPVLHRHVIIPRKNSITSVLYYGTMVYTLSFVWYFSETSEEHIDEIDLERTFNTISCICALKFFSAGHLYKSASICTLYMRARERVQSEALLVPD